MAGGKKRRFRTVWGAFVLLAAAAGAGEAAQGKSYALLVAGESGEPYFNELYKDWASRWHKLFTGDWGVPAAQVTVLMERKDLAPLVAGESTREGVRKAFAALTAQVRPEDQVFVCFMGHGAVQNKSGSFCLPGPDLSSEETAELLNRLPARETVFACAVSSSSVFLDKSSLAGRVVITPNNDPAEGNETYFQEFFLQGFENRMADQDKDGAVDLLEAFNYAALRTPKWYLRQYLEDDGWRVEGKQSRTLWQKFYGQVPDRKMAPAKGGDAEDAEPQLGEWGPQWESRRMPTEHAQLDDNGDKTGTAVFVNNEFTPLTGTGENADGRLAKRTVLGRPRGATKPAPKP